MTLLDVRLAFRLHHFEILGLGALVGLGAIAADITAWMLDATGYGARCWTGTGSTDCEAMGRAFFGLQQARVPLIQSILGGLPFLLAALVGAPLVARELERGTSRLAWSLAPSRLRWLVVRVTPIAVVVFALAFLAGAALDRLLAAVAPGTDVASSFDRFGDRGVVLAARATFVFAVGVAVGSVMGRVLPALLLTAVIAGVGIGGGSYVHSRILASEAVWVDTGTGSGNPGDLFFDQRVRTPDGAMITWDELFASVPQPEDGSDWPPAGYTFVALVVPGARYPSVELREVAALGGASLAALALAALAVQRRRPG
jgi:hypothetical protein